MAKKSALFNEFDPVPTSAWEQKILQDLKGKPLEKLTWESPEGIDVRPFYRAEDLEGIEYLRHLPRRDSPENATGANEWEIRQDIIVGDWKEANAIALEALEKGATSLGFIIPDDKAVDSEAMHSLLKDIYIDCININFVTSLQAAEVIRLLVEISGERGLDLNKIRGSVDADPLGYLGTHGDYPGGTEKAFEDLASLVKKYRNLLPGLRILGINGHHFTAAGSTLVEELAFSLAMVSEYLDKLTGRAVDVDEIACSFQLNLSTGPVYFMEIAKLRAARLLFAHLVQAWNARDNQSLKCYIHAKTSGWNLTVYDPYVNMLRGTTEAMSAVIGGCDSLSVTPFDTAFRKPVAFSERIARNTQVILKEEASLDKVSDTSAGSYFIENLTDSLAANAWNLFLEVENQGGYLKALEEGFIQDKINLSAGQRDLNLATRKEILLGTTQYPNPSETLPGGFDPSVAFPEMTEKSGHIIELIRPYRSARLFEELRIRTEKMPEKPVVFLLTFGNPVMRKARASFASGFFTCGGYQIIDNTGFDTVEEGLRAAFSKNANIVVLCSSDEEYPAAVPEAVRQTDGKALLVVAGFPKDTVEELKAKGVKYFIHLGSNLPLELEKFHKLIGID